ncbi:hypothetical protein NN561_015735 [Cricetulus griseus]
MHTTQKDTTYTKIFVGGLPYHTTDASLRKYFEVFGDIEEAVVITDRQTGKSRGYGFVSYTKGRLGLGRGQLREVLAGRSKTGQKASSGPRPSWVRGWGEGQRGSSRDATSTRSRAETLRLMRLGERGPVPASQGSKRTSGSALSVVGELGNESQIWDVGSWEGENESPAP